ncbi:GL22275 [Drosophila persimilis]|uniref:GL22275 n=1 Tax=Drosophila persimilis TaxID=7234 RepID=B4GFT9_DROPE|nr:uncharacterized protein LOC6591586 [Drosophila persimilis]EDW34474.1 GL22275 [Drosophila persimilis]
MAQDQARSPSTSPSTPTVPTSSDDDKLDVDFEDDDDPESGSSATEAPMGAQAINTTAVTIVPGTVPTSELTTLPTTTVSTEIPTNAVLSSTTPPKAILTKTVSNETRTDQSEEAKLLALFAKNTAALNLSMILLSDILAINRNITWSLEKQKEFLPAIRYAEGLVLNATRNSFFREAELLRSFVKAIRKIDGDASHIVDDVAYMLQLQNETKEKISSCSGKIGDIQSKMIRNSKGFDQKLNRLRQIIQQSIKPKVLNLNLTAGSINSSQVNSLAELENLPIVWKNSKSSVGQLAFLEYQLAILNQTQKRSMDSLREGVQKWAPTNLSSINDQLQSLIISQKRTELDLALCDGDSSKKYHAPSADEEVVYGTIVSDGFFDTRELDPQLTSNAASERYVQAGVSPKMSWYNVAQTQTSGRN